MTNTLWLVEWKKMQELSRDEEEFIEDSFEAVDGMANEYNITRETLKTLKGTEEAEPFKTLLAKFKETMKKQNTDIITVAIT